MKNDAQIQIVNPRAWPAPRGYSNGIVAQGGVLFIAGQIAWNQTAQIVSSDFAAQFLQALDNVIAVVHEAGGRAEDLVKLVAFVTDLNAYRAAIRPIGEGWRARMGAHYPAMSLIGVSELLESGALVEIEGVAVLPNLAG